MLLTFAHPGEAQSFIKELAYEPCAEEFPKLYFNQTDYLFITGEGPEEVLTKLSAVCFFLKNKIKKIINFGIAGALSSELEIGSIYNIRCCYLATTEDLTHNSFSLAHKAFPKLPSLDCITSFKRNLKPVDATKWECIAPIIDREAWANAKVASYYQLPFSCIKLISDKIDYSSESIEKINLCQSIRESSQDWSQRLYFIFKGFNDETNKCENLKVPLPDGFYFTQTQERLFHKYLKSIRLKENLSILETQSKLPLTDLIEAEAIPKKRTQKLLEFMEEWLSPIETKIKKQLNELTTPLAKQGIQITIPRNLEHDYFTLKGDILNQEHLQHVITELQNFSYTKYLALLNGSEIDHIEKRR